MIIEQWKGATFSFFGQEREVDEAFVAVDCKGDDTPKAHGQKWYWCPQNLVWWTNDPAKAQTLIAFELATARDDVRQKLGFAPLNAGKTFVPSAQQSAVLDLVASGEKHGVVIARAGTGKTTTLTQAAFLALENNPRLSIGFTAFNSKIVEPVRKELPGRVKAKTLHAMGLEAIKNHVKATSGRPVVVDKDGEKVKGLIQEAWRATHQGALPERWIVEGAKRLVGGCKDFLLGGTRTDCEFLIERLSLDIAPPPGVFEKHLPDSLGVKADGTPRTRAEWEADFLREKLREVFALVPVVLEGSRKNVAWVDFNDQIWLPVVMDLPMVTYDILLTDEAQDLCPTQIALVAKAVGSSGRIIALGDDKQAIYAFRGSDSRALDSLAARVGQTRQVEVLPLNQTRRCPKRIAYLAQKLVEDFEALPDAPLGEIEELPVESLVSRLGAGDMVVCRTNAPLVALAYDLMRVGKVAVFKNRDAGKTMHDLIARLWPRLKNGEFDEGFSIPQFGAKLKEFLLAEVARLESLERSPQTIDNLRDGVFCLEVMCEGLSTLAQLREKIEEIFGDKDETQCIALSSVHGCKGLEADNVFILRPDLLPHPMAKSAIEKEQEQNILYVALTRAKKRLVVVRDPELEAKIQWVLTKDLSPEELRERKASGTQPRVKILGDLPYLEAAKLTFDEPIAPGSPEPGEALQEQPEEVQPEEAQDDFFDWSAFMKYAQCHTTDWNLWKLLRLCELSNFSRVDDAYGDLASVSVSLRLPPAEAEALEERRAELVDVLSRYLRCPVIIQIHTSGEVEEWESDDLTWKTRVKSLLSQAELLVPFGHEASLVLERCREEIAGMPQ